jgi:two-component system response regulator NreC
MTTPTRILIVDDHAVVRSGLRLILAGQSDFEVVGEAANGSDAVEAAVALRPDVMVLDIAMPGMNGLEAAELIREQVPSVSIVVLTMYDDEAYLRRFLEIGAAGYVLKTAADTRLVEAIRTVRTGAPFIDPSLTPHLMELYRKQTETPVSPAAKGVELSPREVEVLRLVARGHTGQQIADQLGISVSTVETHRGHIADKLSLKGRAQLVEYALSHHLLGEQEH